MTAKKRQEAEVEIARAWKEAGVPQAVRLDWSPSECSIPGCGANAAVAIETASGTKLLCITHFPPVRELAARDDS